MSQRNSRPKGASIFEFRDLDLMLKLEEEADNEGWVETALMASSLGFKDNLMPISRRLAWMHRFGMVDRSPGTSERKWRLTEGGLRVIEARLRAAQASTIEKLPDEAMVEVMANITSRFHLGSPMMAHMLRREFLYGTKPR